MTITKLYLTNKTAPYTPATIQGTWSDTSAVATKALDSSKTDGGINVGQFFTENSASNTFDALLYRGISGPLGAQTISGTVDVVIGILESSTNADFAYKLHIYVTQGDSDTPRGTLLSNYIETTANEWPTTSTGKGLASAQTLSSLAISAGDRIVVEIGYRALNSSTTNFTGTLRYGTQNSATLAVLNDLTAGSTATTTLAGFVNFGTALTEVVLTNRVSQFVKEELDDGTVSGNERVSQFTKEEIGDGVKIIRVSQFTKEEIGDGVKIARVSQFCVEIISKGIGSNPLTNVFVVV